MNEDTLSQDLIQNVAVFIDSYLTLEKDSKIELSIRSSKLKVWHSLSEPTDTYPFCVWIMTSRSQDEAKKVKGFKILVKSESPDFFESSLSVDENIDFDLILERKEFDEQFLNILNLWFKNVQSKHLSKLARDSNSNVKRLMKRIKTEVRGSVDGKLLTECFFKFLTQFEEFYLSSSYESLKQSIEKSQKKIFKKNTLQLKTLFEINPKDSSLFYYLGSYRESHLFIELREINPDLSQTVYLYLFVGYLTRLLKVWNLKATEIKPAQILFEAFEALPMPILLTGETGDVLQYNAAFGRLNLAPSTVQKFENFDEVKNRDQYWTIKKSDFQSVQGERKLTVFLKNTVKKNRSLNSGSQDLGIITSSIAHELNNPIAGILAALEVLMMEDYLDEDTIDELKEMKQSSLRCKQLVETFLGFSRVNPVQTERRNQLLVDCFEQALNLQRFRMIESEVRILLSAKVVHPYSFPLHQPTLTMMAYLIMGEVMTHFHHLMLLEGKRAKGQSIELELHEDADNFQVMIRPQLALNRDFSSKLLSYLLDQEKLSLSYDDEGVLSFSHKIMLI